MNVQATLKTLFLLTREHDGWTSGCGYDGSDEVHEEYYGETMRDIALQLAEECPFSYEQQSVTLRQVDVLDYDGRRYIHKTYAESSVTYRKNTEPLYEKVDELIKLYNNDPEILEIRNKRKAEIEAEKKRKEEEEQRIRREKETAKELALLNELKEKYEKKD